MQIVVSPLNFGFSDTIDKSTRNSRIRMSSLSIENNSERSQATSSQLLLWNVGSLQNESKPKCVRDQFKASGLEFSSYLSD